MNGVAALVAVLTGNAALTAMVPRSNIAPGRAPPDIALPYVSVASVSKVDLNLPTPSTKRQVRQLVDVTGHAGNYPALEDVMRLIRRAAADRLYPPIDGISGVTIHTAGEGPDFEDENSAMYLRTQTFAVIYNEDT